MFILRSLLILQNQGIKLEIEIVKWKHVGSLKKKKLNREGKKSD